MIGPAYDLAAWRQRIPLLAGAIPMNACSQAPQTEDTRAAAQAYLDSWDRAGMDWDAWMAEVERARAEFAALINAEPDEVAVCASVSAAASALASALDFAGERDGVVASGAEFPTVGHVWLAQERRGARVTWVPAREGVVPLDGYDAAIGERTRIVSAAHGWFQSGFVQDVAAIARLAHERGALLFVDAYQTLGTRPVDVRALGVDALASGCLKFLMGVPGIAFLYVRRALAERLEPTVTGWFGRADPFAFDPARLDWAPGARRFDAGTPPVMAAYVARAGMATIRAVGPARIDAWTRALSRRLVQGGRDRGLTLLGTDDPAWKTPTTAFLCPGRDSQAVEARMRERGVLASARGPAIRLAPHFYSTMDEVDAALDTLAASL